MRVSLYSLVAVFLLSSLCAGAETPPVRIGDLASVSLVKISRLAAKDATPEAARPPDGLAFCFLVTRKPDASGRFAIKETRDMRVEGKSYRQLTQAALGKAFEPATNLHDAEKFFRENPAFAVRDIPKDSTIVTVALGGAGLTVGQVVEVTAYFGFGPQVEPFAFRVEVPSS